MIFSINSRRQNQRTYNETIFRNHVEIENSFDLTKREFIGMGRLLITLIICVLTLKVRDVVVRVDGKERDIRNFDDFQREFFIMARHHRIVVFFLRCRIIAVFEITPNELLK